MRSSMPAPQYTPDDELDLLFDPTMIPVSMREAVGSDLHVSLAIASFDLR